MRRARLRIAVGLLCALAPLALASTLVLASSASGTPRQSAHKHRRCARHSRTRTPRRGGPRCRSVHRRAPSALHPAAAPTTSGNLQSGSGAQGTSSGGSQSRSGSGSGSASSKGEVSSESGSAPPPVITHVQVTAVEFSFTLSRTHVPAGKVSFQFVNNGQDEHNLNILPGEGPPSGTFATLPSKGISTQTIDMRSGAYMLFCSLPEHESKGMKATLVVE